MCNRVVVGKAYALPTCKNLIESIMSFRKGEV